MMKQPTKYAPIIVDEAIEESEQLKLRYKINLLP